MLTVPVVVIVGLAHRVQEHAASGRIDNVWLVNYHGDLDTC